MCVVLAVSHPVSPSAKPTACLRMVVTMAPTCLGGIPPLRLLSLQRRRTPHSSISMRSVGGRPMLCMMTAVHSLECFIARFAVYVCMLPKRSIAQTCSINPPMTWSRNPLDWVLTACLANRYSATSAGQHHMHCCGSMLAAGKHDCSRQRCRRPEPPSEHPLCQSVTNSSASSSSVTMRSGFGSRAHACILPGWVV
jgi:hypothetical protein